MFRVIARFKKGIISRSFHNMYDAIEFKDGVEAHYPVSVIFEKNSTVSPADAAFVAEFISL